MHFGEKIGSSFVSVPFCSKATFPGNVAFAMSRLFTNYEGKLRGKYISSRQIPYIFLIENLSVIVQRSQVTLIQCMLPQIQQFPHKHEVTCMSPNMINKSL